MDIVDQAKAVKEAFEPWARSEGGLAFVASDLLHLWNLAYTNTQGVRAIVCYRGESMRGGFDYGAILGRVDRKWAVALCRGRGFNANVGDQLTEVKGNSKPFYLLIQEARDIIRTLQGASVEAPVDYTGIQPMPMNEGSLVDGYMLEFTLVADLPQIVSQPPELAITYPVSLDSLLSTIACDSGQSGGVCPCTDPAPVAAVLQGEPGKTYDVTFNIAGVLEGKTYTGGSHVGYFQTGGTPAATTYNIVKLEVSAPVGTYYLNRDIVGVIGVDYNATVPVSTGATVTLSQISVDSHELANVLDNTVPGYPGILPNQGQWVQVDAISFQQQ